MSTRRFVLLKASPQRVRLVAEDIHAGSDPRLGFYALLVTASLIAALGLIANSTAVIIGAMLVSPLMTPIFGIALGMLRGDTMLFWRALTAEVMGIVLAVGVPFLVALLPLSIEATPEMLSRTSPNLLDLLVAVLAGFAGAFALVDERISPALPGVAIATAIVPPLSNTGLCLALGAEGDAFGSFTLFLANFVSILLVGLVTFGLAGMATDFGASSFSALARRFAIPLTAFVVTTAVLTHTLKLSIGERDAVRATRDELQEALAPASSAKITEIEHTRLPRGNGRHVLATLRAQAPLTPIQVSRLQERLARRLEAPVELVVRTIVARDVAAVGSSPQQVRSHLDGRLLDEVGRPRDVALALAEQVLLEGIASEPGMQLLGVELAQAENRMVFVASLKSFRRIRRAEVEAARDRIRERLEMPTAQLLVGVVESELLAADERFLLEWTNGKGMSLEDELVANDVRRVVSEEIEKLPGLFALGVHIHADTNGEPWGVLAEVVGPAPPAPEGVAALSAAVSARSPRPVETSVWFRTDVVVSKAGYNSFREFTRPAFEKRIESLPGVFGVEGRP